MNLLPRLRLTPTVRLYLLRNHSNRYVFLCRQKSAPISKNLDLISTPAAFLGWTTHSQRTSQRLAGITVGANAVSVVSIHDAAKASAALDRRNADASIAALDRRRTLRNSYVQTTAFGVLSKPLVEG